VYAIYQGNKKSKKLNLKNFVRRPFIPPIARQPEKDSIKKISLFLYTELAELQ
jgi:hypothetical protein